MSTIGRIKSTVREAQPMLDDAISGIMVSLDNLRSCGIFSEEISLLADSLENLEKVQVLLIDRLKGFREYNNSLSIDEIGEED